ncbi:pilS cassette [Neisseria meningitidis]|nr:hypothetical protein NmNIID835_00490 [Neisseria meningitidis]BEQ20699.1 hypothetical protein NmNIID836_12910 [Neisseria meningitidis]BEQ21516.1 hypothetical protein NmNIID838_00490 [Neisseria meningitidis]CWN66555.1 pilS cassette [Neisseria meningitidis]CWT92000.1 pilS cassette [Neisseria meningitidis]
METQKIPAMPVRRSRPSFPRRRESRPVGTETYRINGFSRFRILDSRLRGNDGSGIFIRQIRKVRHRVG